MSAPKPPTPEQLAAIRTAVWESWGALGSLDLHVGDVIDQDDVKLYAAHVRALGAAVDLLGMGGSRHPDLGARPPDARDLGEPMTTDYCRKCGESPESGTHLIPGHGHDYEDPRVRR